MENVTTNFDTELTPSEVRDASVEQIDDKLLKDAGQNVHLVLTYDANGSIITSHMGVDDDGWTNMTNKNGAATFKKFVDRTIVYYQLINNSTKFNERWLSPQVNGARKKVGIYRKYLRSGWKFDNKLFIASRNGEPLSFLDAEKAFLYANGKDQFTILDVHEINA